MFRFVTVICFLLLLLSCDKKRIANRLEGRWVFVKLLSPSGLYSEHADIYEFTGGKESIKSDLPFVVYSQDTLQMLYRITKGNIIQVTNPVSGNKINWLVEDMDKKSLVVRVAHGVMFFEKE